MKAKLPVEKPEEDQKKVLSTRESRRKCSDARGRKVYVVLANWITGRNIKQKEQGFLVIDQGHLVGRILSLSER